MRKTKWRKLLLGILVGSLLMTQMMLPVLADDTEMCVDGSWLTDESEATTEELFDFTREALD